MDWKAKADAAREAKLKAVDEMVQESRGRADANFNVQLAQATRAVQQKKESEMKNTEESLKQLTETAQVVGQLENRGDAADTAGAQVIEDFLANVINVDAADDANGIDAGTLAAHTQRIRLVQQGIQAAAAHGIAAFKAQGDRKKLIEHTEKMRRLNESKRNRVQAQSAAEIAVSFTQQAAQVQTSARLRTMFEERQRAQQAGQQAQGQQAQQDQQDEQDPANDGKIKGGSTFEEWMTNLTGNLLDLYCSGMISFKKNPDDEDDAAAGAAAAGLTAGGIVLPRPAASSVGSPSVANRWPTPTAASEQAAEPEPEAETASKAAAAATGTAAASEVA
jgi:hypothetical protein